MTGLGQSPGPRGQTCISSHCLKATDWGGDPSSVLCGRCQQSGLLVAVFLQLLARFLMDGYRGSHSWCPKAVGWKEELPYFLWGRAWTDVVGALVCGCGSLWS